MDEESFRKLDGAVLDLDPDPAGDGYRLEHPNAVMTTFC
jgi:Fe-S cluster assembly iron-binding protein IscA